MAARPADRVEIFKVSCVAGTTQANATSTDLSFNPGQVLEVEIVVPAGHAGLTGIAIAEGGSIIIPASGDVWIVADDEVIRWPIVDPLNNGAWSAYAYNSDVNDHDWYLRFLVAENVAPAPAPVAPAPLAPSAIYNAPAVVTTAPVGQE